MMPRNFALTPEGQELTALCLDFGYKLEECARDMTRNQINFLLLAKKLRFDLENKAKEEFEREEMLQAMKYG